MNIEVIEKKYNIIAKPTTVLGALKYIKQNINQSLTYNSACKSGVCGCCAVVVNGIEKLACNTTIKDGDKIEPLANKRIYRDLVVQPTQKNILKKIKSYLIKKSDETITTQDEKTIDILSNCILCSSCQSSCPVYTINPNFIAPFVYVRALRYINDKKEIEKNSRLEAIQNDGIYDCTLCGNCDMVCPEDIPIKDSINSLRNKSVQAGHMPPMPDNFMTF
ncbi:MAG: succinate dehydrogenase [Epsilonproteobacteria bacterium]|nr:MAG: succinate dehydrogenase [Campylobacterota bacterium]